MPINTDMHPRQREYNIHASKIKSMRAFKLEKLLAPKRMNYPLPKEVGVS